MIGLAKQSAQNDRTKCHHLWFCLEIQAECEKNDKEGFAHLTKRVHLKACYMNKLHDWLLKTGTLMFTKYQADLLCQNMPHITTKGRGVMVSLPLLQLPC